MAKLTPDRQARVDRVGKELREEMDLTQLPPGRQLSQAALCEILHIERPALAKINKRTGMHVNTLRHFIEAMSGELEIIARFPDRTAASGISASLETVRRRDLLHSYHEPSIGTLAKDFFPSMSCTSTISMMKASASRAFTAIFDG